MQISQSEHHFDELHDALSQVEALVTVAMSTELTSQEPATLFHYLGAIGHIAASAKQICESDDLKNNREVENHLS